MKTTKIVVIGSSNIDMILRSATIPKPGETVVGGQFTTAIGGKGANQAIAAARAGGQVTFVAKVGDDSFGTEAIACFQKEGIDTSCISVDETSASGVALIFVADDGENSIGVASGANANLSPADIDDAKEIITEADILLMQLESPLETVEYAASIAAKSKTQVILNPAPAQELPTNLLKNVSIITPNQNEAELLTGRTVETIADAEKAAEILLDSGINTVVITMGSQGALLATTQQKEHLTGFSVDAVDTTAAGDIFNGNLAFAIAAGIDLSTATNIANAAAAISVTRNGTALSAPHHHETQSFLAKNARKLE